MRLRDLLLKIEEEKPGMVVRVSEELSDYDVTCIVRFWRNAPILIFQNVRSGWSIVVNLCNTRDKLCYYANVKSVRELYGRLMYACSNPKPGVEVPWRQASFSFKCLSGGDVGRLPILKFYPRDPGPYVTSSIIVARNPKDGVLNASVHRMLYLGDDRFSVRIVPRHLWKIYNDAIETLGYLPVLVLIGVHPLVLLASASSPPYGIYELYSANTLLGGEMEFTYHEKYDIPIPAHIEIVLEGRLLSSKEWEGPFVDALGVYDIRRRQPVLEVERVWVSKDAVYHTIVPCSDEHLLLMGFYPEAKIWDNVRRVVPEVKAVNVTKGGCGWLHAIISIRKHCEGDGKNAILAAFAAHPSLKHVIVVDDDIDVYNLEEVEWAVATRFQADKDVVIIRGVRGSSLDPSADMRGLLTSKMGLDATRPLDKPRELFEKVKVELTPKARRALKLLKVFHES